MERSSILIAILVLTKVITTEEANKLKLSGHKIADDYTGIISQIEELIDRKLT
jgi:hypothetical protein